MDISVVNWLAVIVCVVVSMISGTIWYSPRTFFPAWWKGIGKGDSQPGIQGNMGRTWALTVVSSFVQATAMAFMVNAMGGLMSTGVTAASGAGTGFMLWLGFIAPTNLVNKLFAGHGFKVWAIEAGNHLVNLLLFGAILGAWR
jgi:hypothetical protein